MLFLDVELEVDGAGAGGCYAELFGGRGRFSDVQDGGLGVGWGLRHRAI